MRVLMSALPSLGHVHPCLAVAQALRDAGGHEVRVATAPGLAPHIQEAGFTQVNMGFDLPRPGDKLTPRLAQRFHTWLIDSFDFWMEDLAEQVREWAPDVLVHDWSQIAGIAVASRLGVPSAVLGNALRPPLTQVSQSRCWFGVDFEEFGGATSAFGDLLLNFYPPSFAAPGEPTLEHEHFVRSAGYDGADHRERPVWLDGWLDGPLVYVTMGTYYARMPGVIERLVEGAASVPARIVITVGAARDPAEFAPLPGNVRVEQYVPQSMLIPHCTAVICQGGLAAMMAALNHGVPVGCLPVTWGEPLGFNAAERCAQLGAGLIYPVAGEDAGFAGLDPDPITKMIVELLRDGAYRESARALQRELATLPDLREAVPLIESLA
jgi:UDP:flavonoid glycosyltransferase YjiC (YdhE family)